MITNLFKASLGVVLLPVAVVVDAVSLPFDMVEGKDLTAPNTKEVATTIKDNLRKSLKP